MDLNGDGDGKDGLDGKGSWSGTGEPRFESHQTQNFLNGPKNPFNRTQMLGP